ncbi:MAG: HEPN domain-containing protein [Chloroflexi bacterium]|nr:HEPN domain-containing protein [Chloroflexota bacterium]
MEPSLPRRQPFGLRMRRATSWLERASREQGDPDAAFIFCWIAFNAAYGDERDTEQRERDRFHAYFSTILKFQGAQAINRALWDRFRNPIKEFVANHYVYWRFWDHQKGEAGADNWAARLEKDKQWVNGALNRKDSRETARVLETLFSRLYVLRNQLLHGGATWRSSVNRDQVRDGARIMFFLVPIFIDVMLKNPDEDWGRPRFPVVYEDEA